MIGPALVAGFLSACAAPPSVAEIPKAEAPACAPEYSFEAWTADVTSRNEDVQMQELDDAERTAFMANFNAIPPVTNLKPERVLVLFKPGLVVVVVAFVDAEDCVFAAKQIPVAALARLLAPAAWRGGRAVRRGAGSRNTRHDSPS